MSLPLKLVECPRDAMQGILQPIPTEEKIAYLNQLLKAEQTSLGRLILRRRLDAVAAALRNPSMATRSISTLALAFGFNDLSHFSKAFRVQHEMTAREYRSALTVAHRAPDTSVSQAQLN